MEDGKERVLPVQDFGNLLTAVFGSGQPKEIVNEIN